MLEHLTAIITVSVVISAFIINNFVLAVVATRKLSSIEMAVRTKIDAVELALRTKIDEHSRAIEREADMESRRFGETISAIREKMNLDAAAMWGKVAQVELYMRDHFVRNEAFGDALRSLEKQIEQSTERLEDRMERLEDKILNGKKPSA